MSKRYWIASIAIGVAGLWTQDLLQATAQSKPPPPSQKREAEAPAPNDAGDEADEASQLLTSLREIEASVGELVSEKNQDHIEQERKRADADLKAQQQMAFWALMMFFAATASTVLTGVGVVLIWRTLHHTRLAAEHAGNAVTQAERGADAAFKAVSVTEDTASKQLRAYVLVKKTGFGHDPETNRYLLYADVYNEGQTPAFDLKIFAGFRIFPDEQERGLTPEEPSEASISAIAPRSYVTAPTASPTADYWAGVGQKIRQGGTLYLIGKVTYRDVFGQQYFTNFRYRMRGRLDFEAPGLEVCPEGNEYS